MRLAAPNVLLLCLTACSTTEVRHLRQFEHIDPDGARSLYTVDMFEKGERRLNGYCVGYYPDSEQKRSEGSNLEGRMHGVWTWWDRRGRIIEQACYDRGALVRKKRSAPWWGYSEESSRGRAERAGRMMDL
ncbi:MAG: hypothetical protein KDC38_15895 [Planctomycetes bacterium]|nr:hypothetical protein [Planctomycetota bacterium]